MSKASSSGVGGLKEANPEGLVNATMSSDSGNQSRQTLQYSDENSGKMIMYQAPSDGTFDSQFTSNGDMSNFFSRPISITTISWAEGATLNGSFDPWHLYFNNPAVKRKLDNFTYISCNLHVKFMLNFSPFYYGYAMFSYIPLYKYYGGTTPDFGQGFGSEPKIALPLSQMPHVNVYPQNCQAGDIVLPFFYPQDWLTLKNATTMTNMGTIYYFSPVALQNANSVSSEAGTIQVLAWAENVKIFGPTADLSMQSSEDKNSSIFEDFVDIDLSSPPIEIPVGKETQAIYTTPWVKFDPDLEWFLQSDEYQTGPVSSVASAIARATGLLGRVPLIGKYMTATSFLANTAADVARWFGYTNPPVIVDVSPFRSTPFGGFANTDISFPLEKLTLDCKNELSVDPTIVGLPSNDEMTISNIVGRESMLTVCEWDQDNAVDDILFSAIVTPQHFSETTVSPSKIATWATPAAHLSRCFWSWRGDIIYRFRFIMSKFHKGRARITWDPSADIVTSASTMNVAFNKIVDISSESDIEIRVPYMRPIPYARLGKTPDVVTFRPNSATAYALDPHVYNGQLTLRVFTKQTSPVLESDVFVVVSTRCAENFEFANPRDPISEFSYFIPQSAETSSYDYPELFSIDGGQIKTDDNISLVCNGETILSTRQLLRRTTFNRYVVFPSVDDAVTEERIHRINIGRFPRPRGYDPNGVDISAGIIAPLFQFNANYDKNSHFEVIVPMFIGTRGSMNLHVNVDDLRTVRNVTVSRRIGTHDLSNFREQFDSLTTSLSDYVEFGLIANTATGCGGMHLTNQITQAGMSVVAPLYSIYRFITASPKFWTNGAAADSTDLDGLEISFINRPRDETGYKRLVTLNYSIGADFGLHFLLCVPLTYRYTLLAPFDA